jgi:hypothetical protein
MLRTTSAHKSRDLCCCRNSVSRVEADCLVEVLGDDGGLWLKLRDQVGGHDRYRDDVPEYRYLSSWVAAHHMRADSYHKLNSRSRSKLPERASWRADLFYNDRLIAFLTPRLLNAALLNPALHELILQLKLPTRRSPR